MGVIRPGSATIATLYITFLALIVLCIYNFTPRAPYFTEQTNYGVVLVVLAGLALVTGVTAEDPDDPLLRAFLLCLASLWGSVGAFHLTRNISTPVAVPPSEALFPGYGAFFFIFLLFAFGCVLHQSAFAAVLSLGLFLASIFEIASLWRPVHKSAGAYYILLGALVIYAVCKLLVEKLCGEDHHRPPRDKLPSNDPEISRDYIVVGYAMDAISFAVFASHVTGATRIACNAFTWVATAGFFQTAVGIVGIRREDAYFGCYFTLHGIFWESIAYNLGIVYFTAIDDPPLLAVYVFFTLTFLLLGFISVQRDIFCALQHLSLAVFCVALCVDGVQGRFLGAMGWICFLLALYGLAAHLSRIESSRLKLPLGRHCFESARLKSHLLERARCCARCIYGKLRESGPSASEDLFSTDFTAMGYSKYTELDMVGYAVNAVSGLSFLWIPGGSQLLVLPWVAVLGGISQFIVGTICFARGLTFESCSFIVFSALWLIWGSALSLGVLATDHSVAMCIGCISFMVTGLLLVGLSMVISKAWFLLTFLFELVVLAFLLHTLQVPSHEAYQIVVVLLFTLVCLYCFLASGLKAIWRRDILPAGTPIIQVSYLHSQGARAFWASGKKASGVKAIADIMNSGGICGIPTDTVYVLVAACKFPRSVERAYNTKKLAEDRPMSMWISDISQLSAARPEFGELLWDLMNEVWPSTISLVVKKGPWLRSLGIGYAEKYIGRPDSIAVRMPDNAITSFLLDLTGPVATTSANPTGEADTTHHLQVLAKLGLKNCDGILCDGPSFENSASTVVDCRKISEGKLGFFRIGLVPQSRVEELFEKVQKRHIGENLASPGGSGRSSSYADTSKSRLSDLKSDNESLSGHVNLAFDDSETTLFPYTRKTEDNVDQDVVVSPLFQTETQPDNITFKKEIFEHIKLEEVTKNNQKEHFDEFNTTFDFDSEEPTTTPSPSPSLFTSEMLGTKSKGSTLLYPFFLGRDTISRDRVLHINESDGRTYSVILLNSDGKELRVP